MNLQLIAPVIASYLLVGVAFLVRALLGFRAIAEERGVAHQLSVDNWVDTIREMSILIIAWPVYAAAPYSTWSHKLVDRYLERLRREAEES